MIPIELINEIAAYAINKDEVYITCDELLDDCYVEDLLEYQLYTIFGRSLRNDYMINKNYG
jgi:hypothetical protein